MLFFTLPIPSWTITPTFEGRLRFERRNDKDFYDIKNDNRSDFFQRYRLGLEGKSDKGIKFGLEYQWGDDDDVVSGAWDRVNNSDLRLFWVSFPIDKARLQVGRQEFKLNDAVLIGSPAGWSNYGRSFDGFNYTESKFNVFAFKEGTINPYNQDAKLIAAAYKTELGNSAVIFKTDHNGSTAKDLWTLNHYAARTVKNYKITLDTSAQLGSAQGSDVRAWAYALNVSKKHAKGTAYIEFDSASGGTSGNAYATFDNLYRGTSPTYGVNNLQGYRNVNELIIGGTYQATKKLTLSTFGYASWLRDASDAWYGYNGTANKGGLGTFVDVAGLSGHEVGQTIQFEGKYKLDKSSEFAIGLGSFFPGKFVRTLEAGANRQDWFYTSYTVKF